MVEDKQKQQEIVSMSTQKKKKVGAKEALTIQLATAAHLVSEDFPCTRKVRLKNVYRKVIAFFGGKRFNLHEFASGLQRWIEEGWATFADGFLQVTRAGRVKIKSLAEQATAPPEAVPT